VSESDEPGAVLSGYLEDALRRLRGHRRLVERALAQVSDADFFRAPGPESNSIGLIVKHLSGNMRSRFTDFLESDGEKPDRRRDREFEAEGESRDDLMKAWEAGWETTLSALEKLGPGDLGRTVRIRTEPHTVIGAINRHLAHLAYHAGQIAYLAKHWAGPRWETLSIPRGGSDASNEAIRKKHEGRG
jgi:hypothetical protein